MSELRLLPFRFRRTNQGTIVAVSITGDPCVITEKTLEALKESPEILSPQVLAELQAKFFLIRDNSPGLRRLLESRVLARHRTVASGPSLFIVVPTLYCEHSCRYCQVSRAIDENGVSLSTTDLRHISRTISETTTPQITVEFQGGDPLLRFDLIKFGIEQIVSKLDSDRVSFVVASTLHQLDEDMCAFFRDHNVQLSTSIDGPPWLHNALRPVKTKNSFDRTIRGIDLARRIIGDDSVAALATITKLSLPHGREIVDTYATLGLGELSLRPVSPYGFANRKKGSTSVTTEEYATFYNATLNEILKRNFSGARLREGQAAIVLNKLLSPIDRGYVDLQCIPGGGTGALIFNYDGYVYPSDEARMLAETGDTSLRLGRIGDSLQDILSSPALISFWGSGISLLNPVCDDCAYGFYCGPDITQARASFGTQSVPTYWTSHCRNTLWIFDYFVDRLQTANDLELDVFREWSRPN
jgi:His-Xaa-Ser system radical SAM maturase HxsB